MSLVIKNPIAAAELNLCLTAYAGIRQRQKRKIPAFKGSRSLNVCKGNELLKRQTLDKPLFLTDVVDKLNLNGQDLLPV